MPNKKAHFINWTREAEPPASCKIATSAFCLTNIMSLAAKAVRRL